MDKQKQVEEMAKIIFEKAYENYETSGSVEIDTEVRRYFYSAFLVYCEPLYNAGYRKIPENAVVLTREEFSEKIENTWLNCQEFTRKETAEKFSEKLKTECYDGGIDNKWVHVSFSRLDEICKELTEGKNGQ